MEDIGFNTDYYIYSSLHYSVGSWDLSFGIAIELRRWKPNPLLVHSYQWWGIRVYRPLQFEQGMGLNHLTCGTCPPIGSV